MDKKKKINKEIEAFYDSIKDWGSSLPDDFGVFFAAYAPSSDKGKISDVQIFACGDAELFGDAIAKTITQDKELFQAFLKALPKYTSAQVINLSNQQKDYN